MNYLAWRHRVLRNAEAVVLQPSTGWVVFQVGHFLAPEFLVFSTCLVALVICSAARRADSAEGVIRHLDERNGGLR
jgi:uncharacterized membrane protein